MSTEVAMAMLIAGALRQDGVSQAEFCRRAGVSPKHLNLVLNGKAAGRASTLDYWAWLVGRRFIVQLAEGREP